MFASEFVTTQFKYIASMSFVLGKKYIYWYIHTVVFVNRRLEFCNKSWRHDDVVFHEIYFSTFLNIWHVFEFLISLAMMVELGRFAVGFPA